MTSYYLWYYNHTTYDTILYHQIACVVIGASEKPLDPISNVVVSFCRQFDSQDQTSLWQFRPSVTSYHHFKLCYFILYYVLSNCNPCFNLNYVDFVPYLFRNVLICDTKQSKLTWCYSTPSVTFPCIPKLFKISCFSSSWSASHILTFWFHHGAPGVGAVASDAIRASITAASEGAVMRQ